MSINKKNYLIEDGNQNLANFAKALSHPVRVEILKILAKEPFCYCHELVSKIHLAQSTVSIHLGKLRSLHLIARTVSGQNSLYTFNWPLYKYYFTMLKDYTSEIEFAQNELCSDFSHDSCRE